MDIRVNHKDDLERGLALVEETWVEWVPLAETLEAAQNIGIAEHHRKKLEQPGAFFVAAVQEEILLGFAIMLPENHGFHLNFIAVSPRVRQQGIAGFLLDACLAEARRRGAEQVSTGTWSNNVAARRLYEGQGFIPIQTISDDRGPGIDSIYYRY